MTDLVIRKPNTGKYADGFRIMQGKQEYVTYPEGSTFRMWESDVSWRYETHTHSAVEVVLTRKGRVVYDIAGRRYDVDEGEIILVPPGMDHGLSMGDGSSRTLFLFEPETVFSMGDVKQLSEGFNKVFYLRQNSPGYPEVYDLLTRAADAYREQDLMWNTRCFSYVLGIYAVLGREYLSSDSVPARSGDSTMDMEIISSAMSYINNHYREDLTLDDVAMVAGFSRFYFSRSFKKHTGYSFKEYLCQKRLQVAMDLLIRTDFSMSRVAEESGFGSVATFNRVFRDYKNCTPTQYRAIYGTY